MPVAAVRTGLLPGIVPGRQFVNETGIRNGAFGADKFGFQGVAGVHWNLTAPALYEHAVANNEAHIVEGGALCAETGVHTGRSPKDKHTVSDAITENSMWWDGNRKITPEQFQLLHDDFIAHAKGRQLFAQDLYGGADPKYRIRTRVFTELAWHSLFIRTLLIRPERSELASFVPEFTVVDLPSFKADPKRHGVRSETVIAIDFSRKIVLIGNSSYAGEMKKSVFTTLNFYLPAQGVKVCFVDTPGANGTEGSQIELIEPLGEDSPIHGFLAKNPLGGQHHVCFEVPDIHAAKVEFEAMGMRVLGEPRIGAHGTLIFFVHPKDMGGMLTEIMETPKDH